MCKVISLKALETNIQSELSAFELTLTQAEMANIKSFILFISCTSVPAGKTLKWISLIDHNEVKWELVVQIEKESGFYSFILSNGKETHEWKYTPCYIEQNPNHIDANSVDTDKIFEDIVHLVGDKSLYSREIYKGDGRLISEEAQRLQDAAYSAINFLDGVVNDCIYQESAQVTIFNENHLIVKYPFCIGQAKGSFIFNVAKHQEISAVSYTLIYDGFECAIWDVLIVNL